jgi:hypothetical protein
VAAGMRGGRGKRRGGLKQLLFVFFACGVPIETAQLLFRACPWGLCALGSSIWYLG